MVNPPDAKLSAFEAIQAERPHRTADRPGSENNSHITPLPVVCQHRTTPNILYLFV